MLILGLEHRGGQLGFIIIYSRALNSKSLGRIMSQHQFQTSSSLLSTLLAQDHPGGRHITFLSSLQAMSEVMKHKRQEKSLSDTQKDHQIQVEMRKEFILQYSE